MYKGNTRRPVSDEWGWFELSHCGIQNLSGCCRVEVGGSSSSNMKNSCTRVCLHSIGATTLKKYLCTSVCGVLATAKQVKCHPPYGRSSSRAVVGTQG